MPLPWFCLYFNHHRCHLGICETHTCQMAHRCACFHATMSFLCESDPSAPALVSPSPALQPENLHHHDTVHSPGAPRAALAAFFYIRKTLLPCQISPVITPKPPILHPLTSQTFCAQGRLHCKQDELQCPCTGLCIMYLSHFPCWSCC